MTRQLVILGGGGFAREVAWLASDINQLLAPDEAWEVVGFLEHTNERVGQRLNGIPIINVEEATAYLPDAYATVAIGAPQAKESAVRQAEELGFKFAMLIHPNVRMDRNTVQIGEGCVVCAGNILTVNITIGKHVIVNLDCTIGHDCVIEDLVTISPGCHLSGYTTVRRGAYLGTGAVTIERHEIGANSVIGAGAVVIRNIPANVTAVGVPAKVIGADAGQE